MRKGEQIFSKRPFGGESLLIWGAFSSNGKAKLIEMKGKQNDMKYIEILENSQLSFIQLYEHKVIFQQDNSAKHTKT